MQLEVFVCFFKTINTKRQPFKTCYNYLLANTLNTYTNKIINIRVLINNVNCLQNHNIKTNTFEKLILVIIIQSLFVKEQNLNYTYKFQQMY